MQYMTYCLVLITTCTTGVNASALYNVSKQQFLAPDSDHSHIDFFLVLMHTHSKVLVKIHVLTLQIILSTNEPMNESKNTTSLVEVVT